jgi:hypothetical protein
MTRQGPDRPPVHLAFEHVNAFASVVGVAPGLLGLRQVNKTTFSLLLDTKVTHAKKAGRDNVTYSMIDLRLDVDGQWYIPVMTDTDEVIGRQKVSVEEAAQFGAPYIKDNLAKQAKVSVEELRQVLHT